MPHIDNTLSYIDCRSNPVNIFLGNPKYSNNGCLKVQDRDDVLNRIRIMYNFKFLYYCIKFKQQFRYWLWVKVRENKQR